MRKLFLSGRTKPMEWRRQQLESMLKMLDDNRDKFCDALKQDLSKVKKRKLGNNCIQNVHLWRYMVGYMFGNLFLK